MEGRVERERLVEYLDLKTLDLNFEIEREREREKKGGELILHSH